MPVMRLPLRGARSGVVASILVLAVATSGCASSSSRYRDIEWGDVGESSLEFVGGVAGLVAFGWLFGLLDVDDDCGSDQVHRGHHP
jgi:hypothetical protein